MGSWPLLNLFSVARSVQRGSEFAFRGHLCVCVCVRVLGGGDLLCYHKSTVLWTARTQPRLISVIWSMRHSSMSQISICSGFGFRVPQGVPCSVAKSEILSSTKRMYNTLRPLADGWFTVYYKGIGVYQFYDRITTGCVDNWQIA